MLGWVTAYMLVGMLIAEGCIWARSKEDKPITVGSYIIIVVGWPPVLVISLVAWAILG